MIENLLIGVLGSLVASIVWALAVYIFFKRQGLFSKIQDAIAAKDEATELRSRLKGARSLIARAKAAISGQLLSAGTPPQVIAHFFSEMEHCSESVGYAEEKADNLIGRLETLSRLGEKIP